MIKDYLHLFDEQELRFGRNFGSKMDYQNLNFGHFIIFNARIYTLGTYKKYINEIKDFFKGQEYEIWYCYINFNADLEKLM